MRIPSTAVSVAAVALLSFLSAPASDAGGGGKGKKVTFLTQNLYAGADLAPAIAAVASGDTLAILTEVGTVWAKVQATDFPARAKGLANEIHKAKPDVVGLQEASLWRVGPPGDPSPATTVAYDFVQILVDALAARGEHYDVAVVSQGVDAEFPGFVPASPFGALDIRLTDREALLVRHESGLKVSNAQAGHFAANAAIPTPFGPFVVARGWAAADIETGGKSFRFVTTHLEADDGGVRVLQGLEVIAGPCATSLPVVCVGDFNSDGNGGPDGAAYSNFRAAGFGDSWTDVHDGELGITWGHDELLVNPVPFSNPLPNERIDFVLHRGGTTAEDADRVGEAPADRISGLWPSDHAGVVATVRIP